MWLSTRFPTAGSGRAAGERKAGGGRTQGGWREGGRARNTRPRIPLGSGEIRAAWESHLTIEKAFSAAAAFALKGSLVTLVYIYTNISLGV